MRNTRKTNRMRPAFVVAPLAFAGFGLAVSACGSSSPSPTASPKTTSAPAPAKAAAAQTVTVNLQLQTGKQDGKPGWPRFTPADVTVPKGAHVHLVITSYDDGAAPLSAAMTSYDNVQGGTEAVDGVATSSVPNANVAHTFTVASLGLNAVIPAVAQGKQSTTVTFDFTATKAGTYTWKCFAPCGDGSDGMGGAMATSEWMQGNLTVD